jgi:hypothetical protein
MDTDRRQGGGAAALGKPGRDGTGEAFGTQGVWVPKGMTAREIMVGAEVLEKQFDVPPYQSRSMVRAILDAIRAIGSQEPSCN